MFKIDQDKLHKITKIFNNETDPKATEERLKSEICADWHEGEEHQEWINNATPEEIVEWLASFYI